MQSDNHVVSTLKQLGPWVISFIALVQVWIIASWKKFRHGRVEIYESGQIEVGYSVFGPTIGLMGTLQALHKEVFVERMSLTIVRARDNATHDFGWRAFRPRSFALGDTSNAPQEFELASSFLIDPKTPFRYNVFFVDHETLAELRPAVDPIPKAWTDFRTKRIAELKEEHGDGIEAALNEPLAQEALYTEFGRTPEELAAFTALDRHCYWEAGEYVLELQIECAQPDRDFTKEWSFTLTDADSNTLRVNAVTVIRNILGLPANYGFAYAAYE